MPPQETLRQILDLAVHAPSGDNSQPWEFAIGPSSIFLFNLPERDETLYNFRQHGSYVAHGAVAENIAIISSQLGYRTIIRPFPGRENCTAEITFTSTNPTEEVLYSVIEKRTTNRKPYAIKILESQHTVALLKSVANFSETQLLLVEDRQKITEVAGAVGFNERLLMENRHLHDFLFSMIRWTRQEESNKPGLFVDTMEFPPPIKFLFQYVLCRWQLVRLMNVLGFSRMLSKQTAGLYGACSAVGAITIKDLDNTAFFNAGRAFQRLWLTATYLGLSLQPITALPYLTRRVHAEEAEAFSKDHANLIRHKHTQIAKAFSIASDDHIAMLFRIGYDGTPSAYSAKLPAVIKHIS